MGLPQGDNKDIVKNLLELNMRKGYYISVLEKRNKLA